MTLDPATPDLTSGSVVLSIFPGIDLLGRGFEQAGFCVVRGPDPLWGGDILDFHPPRNVIEGIIGGSPCQDFSKLRRAAPSGLGVAMLAAFARCVTEAWPLWFLLENVPGVPDVKIEGYTVQRFNVRASEFGAKQHRLRTFQFGSRDGARIVLGRPVTRPVATEAAAIATEANRKHRRTWKEFCALQGLPELELPGMTKAAKYRAVGNGVFVPLARAVAVAIKLRTVTAQRVCVCGCCQPVPAGRLHATPACRKRMQRRRDAAGIAVTGPDTAKPAQTLSLL